VPKTFLVDRQLCVVLLRHNPYRLPQHYKKHICGPSYSCKHWFLWISMIFEHKICLNYMGTVCHWQLFWSTRVRFIGQCWYFNPQWTAGQVIIKGELCLEQHDWKNCAVAMWQHKSGFLEGFRRWRGSILVTQRNPDLHGSRSLPKHCGISDKSEQNSSKLRHTVCDVFVSHLAI